MGCDIHMFAEMRKRNAGHDWDTFGGEFHLPRNYTLFGLLADVRGKGPPVVEPRGLPDRPAWETRDAYEKWGRDAHTPHWLTLDEFEEALQRLDEPDSWLAEYHALKVALRYLVDQHGMEGRVVFWFDN